MPTAWDVTSAGATAGSGGCATDTAADKWAKCKAVFDLPDRAGQERQDLRDQPALGRRRRPVEAVQLQHRRLRPGHLVRAEHRLLRQPEAAAGGLHVLRVHRRHDRVHGAQDRPARRRLHPAAGPARRSPAARSCRRPTRSAARTTCAPAYAFGIQYFLINFNNPTLGPAFKQLYVRQAMQELIDQEGMIKSVDRGYGYPTSGGVPTQPTSQWVPVGAERQRRPGPVRVLRRQRHLAADQPRLEERRRRDDLPVARHRRDPVRRRRRRGHQAVDDDGLRDRRPGLPAGGRDHQVGHGAGRASR